MWLAPFVCYFERFSLYVRPIVLMLRPLLNFSIGYFLGHAAAGLVFR